MDNNFTLEEIYDYTFVQVFRLYTLIVGTVHLMLIPLVFFMIFSKSSTMGCYKWYILSNTIWNGVSELIGVITEPKILSPLPLAIIDGIVTLVHSPNLVYIVIELYVYCCLNIAFSIMASLIYRMVIIFQNPKGEWLFGTRNGVLLLIGSTQLVATAMIAMIEWQRGFFLSDQNKESILSKFPFLQELYDQDFVILGKIGNLRTTTIRRQPTSDWDQQCRILFLWIMYLLSVAQSISHRYSALLALQTKRTTSCEHFQATDQPL